MSSKVGNGRRNSQNARPSTFSSFWEAQLKPIAEPQSWTIRMTLSLGRIAEMNAERYAAWSVKRYGMEGLPEEPKPISSGATQRTLGGRGE
jgi:hypothetical protein